VQLARQLAGAAAEIDDAHPRPMLDQRDEIIERLPSLGLESLVLRRVPAHRK
jgi:hypothetical protein